MPKFGSNDSYGLHVWGDARGVPEVLCTSKLHYENPIHERHMRRFAWFSVLGMEFLSRNRIVHRDLATRNCLLSQPEGGRVCVSDFGLSRIHQVCPFVYLQEKEQIYSNIGLGPARSMAPECRTHFSNS